MWRALPRLFRTTSIKTRNPGEEANFRSVERCPFAVKRTASDNIPVYVYHKNNKNLAVTVIKKVRGDVARLKSELEFLCRVRIDVKPGGILEMPGNHKRSVRGYLKGIGY